MSNCTTYSIQDMWTETTLNLPGCHSYADHIDDDFPIAHAHYKSFRFKIYPCNLQKELLQMLEDKALTNSPPYKHDG